ncbi:MAG: biotin/lipoyl-containing protein [Bacilli bacterium]|jgi:biotin carboxyl carrier protein|nr:acetyl-CoA carboxylase biotin carboxyl carrier protein subunit [Bacilli bacterium]MDD4056956.1 acetyl-CoA carboxylase biotin carboxyl carrier protein subunit [Bacilli bacterium]
MKVYKVKVNGKVYEVELESVSEQTGSVAPAQPVQPAPKVAEPVKASSEGTTIKAPMQGVIIGVKVQVGSAVKKGQAVVILEAMKLENEIVAPADGVVKQILVSKGQTVNNQQPLVVIG